MIYFDFWETELMKKNTQQSIKQLGFWFSTLEPINDLNT